MYMVVMKIRVLDGAIVRLPLAEWDDLVAEPEQLAQYPATVQSLTSALNTARNRAARIRIEAGDPNRISNHHAWVTETTTVLLMEVHNGEYQVVPTSTALIPAALADILRVYPGQPSSAPTPQSVPADLLDDLLARDAARRAAACKRYQLSLAWRLSIYGPARAQAIGGVLGPSGHAMLAAGENTWSLVPVTTRRMWRTLTTVPTKLISDVAAGHEAPEGGVNVDASR